LGSALDNARLYGDLQRESDLLRRILLNMAEGVFVTDGHGRVLLSNHSAQALLGLFQGQILPEWLRTRLGEGQAHSSLAEERVMVSVSDRVISLSAADMANGGEPVGAVYVARDVTHETQVERMKSEFLAYASHELRTPLTTIRMALHLLAMDVPRDPKVHEQIGVIETQVSRQTHMVDNLLDLARLEAGRYEMPLDLVDLHRLVAGTVRGMRPLGESKGLCIELVEPSEPVVTLTNAGGLEQVFTNLLSNAIKYTSQGGVTVTSGRSDTEVFVAFRDTGIGMTPEQRARLFSKFYTVRNPRRRGEGTGLGLAICSMIVRELQGRIDVQSEAGKGSQFTVYLPLRAAAPDGASPQASS
jgi:signal transduction histidine kinase